MKKLATVLGVLFAVVVVLAAGVVMVGAQETTNDSSPPAGSIATGFGRGLGQELVDPEAIHAAIAGALGISVDELAAARAEGKSLATLADELGVDLADVQAAVQAVVEEAVTQAVADGTITQAQADQILARIAEDGLGALRGPRGERAHPLAGIVDREAVQAAIADTLGISVDELAAAHAEGTTLATLADEQGVSLDDVQAAVQAVVEEAVAQAVADGTITQAQADQILARLAEWPGFGLGGPRGGGFNPAGFNNNGASDA